MMNTMQINTVRERVMKRPTDSAQHREVENDASGDEMQLQKRLPCQSASA